MRADDDTNTGGEYGFRADTNTCLIPAETLRGQSSRHSGAGVIGVAAGGLCLSHGNANVGREHACVGCNVGMMWGENRPVWVVMWG